MNRANRILIVGTIVSILVSTGGGGIGVWLGAPFYFGFFMTFVLAGLVTMFWLAAAISGPTK